MGAERQINIQTYIDTHTLFRKQTRCLALKHNIQSIIVIQCI